MKTLLTIILLFSYSFRAIGCGQVYAAGCDTGGTKLHPDFTIDETSYANGDGSCVAPNNARYTFYTPGTPFPVAGLRFEFSFFSTDSGSHQVRVVTDVGAQNTTRSSVVSIPVAADGTNDWFQHTHTWTFPADTTELMLYADIRVKKNSHFDIMTLDLYKPVGEENKFEYTLNTDRIVNFTYDHLANATIENMTENFDVTIEGSKTLTISHVPSVASPDVRVSCDDINSVSFTVNPTEPAEGIDSFTVNCLSGQNGDGDFLFYEVINNTSKNYCFPIEFQINLDYQFIFKDTVKSIPYDGTISDVRTQFL